MILLEVQITGDASISEAIQRLIGQAKTHIIREIPGGKQAPTFWKIGVLRNFLGAGDSSIGKGNGDIL